MACRELRPLIKQAPSFRGVIASTAHNSVLVCNLCSRRSASTFFGRVFLSQQINNQVMHLLVGQFAQCRDYHID